jgi:hypothetical protein
VTLRARTGAGVGLGDVAETLRGWEPAFLTELAQRQISMIYAASRK